MRTGLADVGNPCLAIARPALVIRHDGNALYGDKAGIASVMERSRWWCFCVVCPLAGRRTCVV